MRAAHCRPIPGGYGYWGPREAACGTPGRPQLAGRAAAAAHAFSGIWGPAPGVVQLRRAAVGVHRGAPMAERQSGVARGPIWHKPGRGNRMPRPFHSPEFELPFPQQLTRQTAGNFRGRGTGNSPGHGAGGTAREQPGNSPGTAGRNSPGNSPVNKVKKGTPAWDSTLVLTTLITFASTTSNYEKVEAVSLRAQGSLLSVLYRR